MQERVRRPSMRRSGEPNLDWWSHHIAGRLRLRLRGADHISGSSCCLHPRPTRCGEAYLSVLATDAPASCSTVWLPCRRRRWRHCRNKLGLDPSFDAWGVSGQTFRRRSCERWLPSPTCAAEPRQLIAIHLRSQSLTTERITADVPRGSNARQSSGPALHCLLESTAFLTRWRQSQPPGAVRVAGVGDGRSEYVCAPRPCRGRGALPPAVVAPQGLEP